MIQDVGFEGMANNGNKAQLLFWRYGVIFVWDKMMAEALG